MNLSIGSVLSRMMDMVRQRLGALVGLAVVYFVLQIILSVVFAGAISASMMTMGMGGASPMDAGFGIGVILGGLVFYVTFLLLYFAQSVAMTHHASPILTPDFGQSFMVGLKSLPTLLGLTLLMIVAYIAFAIVAGIAAVPFAMMGEAGSQLFAVLLLIASLYLACRLALAIPVIAVDEVKNPITAIKRSWVLTRGNALKIFLAFLVFTIILIVALFALFAAFGGSMVALTDPVSGMSALGGGLVVGMILVFMLLMIVVYVVMTAFMASLHASLAGPETVADTFG